MTRETYYTIYLAKDDTIVAYGNVRNIAKRLGKTDHCVESLISKSINGKNKKYIVVKEILDCEDDGI